MKSCPICGKEYARDSLADYCEKSHSTIFIEMKTEDLFKLIQFIYTGDKSLLSKSLMDTLEKYKKGSYV